MTQHTTRPPTDHTKATRGVKPRLSAATASIIAATLGIAALAPTEASAAPNTDVSYPVFSGSPNPVPKQPADYLPGNHLGRVFAADRAAGAGRDVDHDFWVDRMLAREGTAPGGSNGDANQWLFSRGRAVFMKVHDPAAIGFGGEVAYWESLAGRKGAYTVSASVDGQPVTFTELPDRRKQTPSYWHSVFEHAASGVRIEQTKFITQQNVAVTNLTVSSTDGKAKEVALKAASSFAANAEGEELTGSIRTPNDITTVFPRFSGDGFTANDGALHSTLEVPASGSATTKLQLGFATKELPDSVEEYDAYRSLTPKAAYTRHVTGYNRWWVDNIPYLDTPEDNIDKTLFYRWWLLRFNSLDADVPGNDYQFPTSIEGVLGYNNAIDLTIGMFVDDLKYLRDPSYAYGTWVSAGETAGDHGEFRDNPGDPANWSASHTQYISESAWQSYQVHGGPPSVAELLGSYAERDTAGQLAVLDTNKNHLLDTDWNAWTGNDADAVSFDWKEGASLDRAESAYVYSGAMAGAQALELAGKRERAKALRETAQQVKQSVLDVLWDEDEDQLLHAVAESGEQVPWKEINNYYPFAVGMMPKPGEADYDDDYVNALRLFADDEQFPIFPFYTANQADKAAAAEAGHPGSNNFSVINSTVLFRMVTSVLRNYPTEAIDAEWYKKLLYWNAWAHYQGNGDNRYPDQNEFWADGSADPQKIGYRSWIHHTMLGTTNWTVIEDAMGLRPRDDAKIELDPIDVGWDHFTVDNLRYHGHDLTITWDEPGGERHYGSAVPEGYSVFLDGRRVATVDKLSHIVYDPATGTVEAPSGTTASFAEPADLDAARDVTLEADDRVVDIFAKAGTVAGPGAQARRNLAAGRPAVATYASNGLPATDIVDGRTGMNSFWGTAGSTNDTDAVTIDLAGDGKPVKLDEVRLYFYRSSSRETAAGYAAPARYFIEVDGGDGGWRRVSGQARAPEYPRGNYNDVRFPAVEASRLRITVEHADGAKTGIKEVQAFNAGGKAPEPTTGGPYVDAWVDSGHHEQDSARLIGLVQGNGVSTEPLTAHWSMVSGPEGGDVLFTDKNAATTEVRFLAPGTYTLRLTAKEGERSAMKDVVVEGSVRAEGSINVAANATPTASYTAGWNEVRAVNDGKPPFFTDGNQSDLWGTWTGNEPPTRWLQYDFASPVRVDRTSIDFWHDSTTGGSGVAVPESWGLQYWNASAADGAGAWEDVAHPSGFGTAPDASNEVSFDPVTTTRLRATFQALPDGSGSRYSAVGVSEWRVFAAKAKSIDAVHVRTTVGKTPEMPPTVDVVYPDGARVETPVEWEPIDSADVAQEGDKTVTGLLDTTTLTATGTVWVRSTLAETITTIERVDVTTPVGVPPALPDTVTVQYNDGSRDSGIAVTWDPIEPAQYAAPGTFEVAGDIPGTTQRATATVVVGNG